MQLAPAAKVEPQVPPTLENTELLGLPRDKETLEVEMFVTDTALETEVVLTV